MRKTVLGLAGAGLAAGLVISLKIPSSAADPLRSTLVALPPLLVALWAIQRWAQARREGIASKQVVLAETVALALLYLMALSRTGWGLPASGTAKLLAAGTFLWLAHRVGRTVVSLRPVLAKALPRRPPWPFFLLPWFVYLALLPWAMENHRPDGDEPYYLLLTHSLAYDLDTDLANNYAQGDSLRFTDRRLEPQPGDPVGDNGELYSRHNLLLPLLLAPFYRLGGLAGVLFVMTAAAAALAWTTLRLAHAYYPDRPRAALAAYALVAFTAPLLLYSYQVWIEVPAALLAATAVERIHAATRRNGSRQRAVLATIAILLILLPLLKLRFIALAVPLAGLMVLRLSKRRTRDLSVLIGVAIGTVAIIAAFNQWMFDKPLKYYDLRVFTIYAQPPWLYLRGLVGFLFDVAFGLFATSPIWILFVPAAVLLVRRRGPLLVDLACFLPYLILLAPRTEWYGAWSPPFRYGMVALPFLGLSLVPLLTQRSRGGSRLVISALVALTLILNLAWFTVPGWTYNLAHGRSALLDLGSVRIGADLARLFPSYIAIRPASFAWPPLALLLLAVLWWRPRRLIPRARQLGVAGLLLAATGVLLAAERLPTRRIEFEAPWVMKDGGRLWPEQWAVFRPGYRSGWILSTGESLSVPLVAGGDRFKLEIDYRFIGPPESRTALHFRFGAKLLAVRPVASRQGWTTLVMDALPRPPSTAPLVISFEAVNQRQARGRVLLDRARVSWGGEAVE